MARFTNDEIVLLHSSIVDQRHDLQQDYDFWMNRGRDDKANEIFPTLMKLDKLIKKLEVLL